jgi:tRNA pseudouridine32 synthase/23S rRNA pseudouridine746 synthase
LAQLVAASFTLAKPVTDSIETLTILTPTSEAWQLLFQDQHLLVVNKPAMLLTVPGRHPANFDCLVTRVQQQFPTAQVVHRLDYDTSGLVILPLTKSALSHISKQFQARTVKKHYQALVQGKVSPDRGSIDAPLAADAERRPLYKVCQMDGKASLTHYQTISYDDVHDLTRLALNPVTGRSHQLRVHLLSIGHPIIGDTLYGNAENIALSPRLCLHAASIKFCHPDTGQSLQFDAPVPF